MDDVRCLLSVACARVLFTFYFLFKKAWCVVCCLLNVGCCSLCAVRCVLFAVCCLLRAGCCLLFVVRCLLFVVCS